MTTRALEAPIQRQILSYLALVPGVRAWRVNSGTCPRSNIRMAPEGTPDICGYLPDGRALFIEVKPPGWKPERKAERERWAIQSAFLEDATSAGCLAFCAHSVEEVSALIMEAIG